MSDLPLDLFDFFTYFFKILRILGYFELQLLFFKHSLFIRNRRLVEPSTFPSCYSNFGSPLINFRHNSKKIFRFLYPIDRRSFLGPLESSSKFIHLNPPNLLAFNWYCVLSVAGNRYENTSQKRLIYVMLAMMVNIFPTSF